MPFDGVFLSLLAPLVATVLSISFAWWHDRFKEKKERDRILERVRFSVEVAVERLERIEGTLRGEQRIGSTDFREGGWEGLEADFHRLCPDHQVRLRTSEFFEDYQEFKTRFLRYVEAYTTFGLSDLDYDPQGGDSPRDEEAQKVWNALTEARGKGQRAREEWERYRGEWDNPLQSEEDERG